MSADLNTTIHMIGNQDDLKAMLRVLRGYTNRSNGTGIYFYAYGIDLSDKEIEEIAKRGEVNFDLSGPYGRFGSLDEVEICQEFAEACPDSKFEYHTDGFTTGANEAMEATYADHVLDIAWYCEAFECESEDYKEYLDGVFPFEKFTEIFDDEDEDDYETFVYEGLFDGGVSNMSYDDFLNMCPAAGVSENGFPKAMNKLLKLNIPSQEAFSEIRDTEQYWTKETIQY